MVAPPPTNIVPFEHLKYTPNPNARFSCEAAKEYSQRRKLG